MPSRFPRRSAALAFAALAAAACASDSTTDSEHGSASSSAAAASDEQRPVEERLAGQATSFELGGLAFSTSGRTLGLDDRIAFFDGRDVFDHEFTAEQGLGPLYNDTSCAACHVNNGRSPVPSSDLTPGAILRVENQDDLQLQTEAIAGFEREDWFNVDWVELDDGLRMPTYASGTDLGPVALRVTPPLVGLGLLEAIPTEVLAELADPDDADGDGISGRLSILDDGAVGRFGWQATSATVDEQTRKALANDMGLELSDELVDLLVLYAGALAVPAARDTQSPDVQVGAAVFDGIGCNACHVSSGFVTGPSTITTSLENHVIFPYTDLLLHDMGEGLADFTGSEFRTQPLWGLGLTEVVMNAVVYEDTFVEVGYLHDGRARTLDEAIRWHGGEAADTVTAYLALPQLSKDHLLTFLAAL